MSSEQDVLERLTIAVSEVNRAAQEPMGVRRQIRAVKRYCSVLDALVGLESLWERFRQQATLASLPEDDSEAWAVLTGAMDPLGAAHANLLRRCGYTIPPPPTVDALVRQTRQSVEWDGRLPRWGIEHVDEARAALGQFVIDVRSHLRWWGGTGPGRALERCRRSGSVVLLVTLLSHGEIKTGDHFQVVFGASLKDFIKVEITIPAALPWIDLDSPGQPIPKSNDLLRAVLINSQIANLGETIDMTQSAIPNRWYKYADVDREKRKDALLLHKVEPNGTLVGATTERDDEEPDGGLVSVVSEDDRGDTGVLQDGPQVINVADMRKSPASLQEDETSETVINFVGSDGEIVPVFEREPPVGETVRKSIWESELDHAEEEPEDDQGRYKGHSR